MACSSFNLSFHNFLRDCACDTLLICHWVFLPLESSLMILERHPSSGKMFWDWNQHPPPPPPLRFFIDILFVALQGVSAAYTETPYSPCWNCLFSLIIFILCQRKRSWKIARIWERKGVKRKTGKYLVCNLTRIFTRGCSISGSRSSSTRCWICYSDNFGTIRSKCT